MADIIEMLKRFYDKYDRNAAINAYETMYTVYSLLDVDRSVSLDAEVRMKNDCFAMQMHSTGDLSPQIITIIGFFFEKYNCDRNCVWTKSEENIKKFFKTGIGEMCSFGGRVILNVENDDIQKIVHLLTCGLENIEEDLFLCLCSNFKQLEKKSWSEFYRDCEKEFESNKENKRIEKVTSMDLSLDWSNAFSSDEQTAGVFAESAADGLVLSINNLGRVDIEYISQITGLCLKDVISELRGSIYQNPDAWDESFYKGWETADEYLSGRVLDKLKSAKEADEKYKGYFIDNVKALKKIIPKQISADDIYVTLGSPWVPEDIVDEFILHLLGQPNNISYNAADKNSGEKTEERYRIKYDPVTGTWNIPQKSRYYKTVKSDSTYGTKRIKALNIIERTLNKRAVFVTDEVASATTKSGKKRVINEQETLLATEKQKIIIKEFQNWIWQDEKRKERLEKIYFETYGSSVIRRYDGGFLSFPDMAETEKLFDYQKNAVARIMFSPNTLLAHEVGSGKTFVMIAAGMEMRRIGISKKNMYVVPNSIVGQWKSTFKRLYPKADILCVEPNCFTPEKRENVIDDIKIKIMTELSLHTAALESSPHQSSIK